MVKDSVGPKNNIKRDVFTDYPQRQYNFEELEKKLLGL
jgi:plasmid replication initiation protein